MIKEKLYSHVSLKVSVIALTSSVSHALAVRKTVIHGHYLQLEKLKSLELNSNSTKTFLFF